MRSPLRSSATASRRNSRTASTQACDARRLRRDSDRPSALLDPARSEQGEKSHQENAEQEGEVDPCTGSAPIHVPRKPGDRDEFQQGERGVSSGQGPDSRDIILAVRMERGNADPDEPGTDGARGQGRQSPRPRWRDDVRNRKEARSEGEHAHSLAEDDRPHPDRRRGPARRIASRRSYLEPSDEEHAHRDADVDHEPEPRCALGARDRTGKMELAEVKERRDERQRREEPDRRDCDAGPRPDFLAGRDQLHRDRGPVRRSEERGRQRRRDGPREVRVRLLREDCELQAREEYQGARRIQEPTHRRDHRPNDRSETWLRHEQRRDAHLCYQASSSASSATKFWPICSQRSLRIRISRTPGPIRWVHSFSSSPVTVYPRDCHQENDFQGVPAALRLVPSVTARLPSRRARSSTNRTRWVPIPRPWSSLATSMLISSISAPRSSVVTKPAISSSLTATKSSSPRTRFGSSHTAESHLASEKRDSERGVPNPTSSSSATEVFEIRTRAGMSSLVADRTKIRDKTSDTERPCHAPFIWITVKVPPSPSAAHGATETHFVVSQATSTWTSRLIARLLRAPPSRLGGERRELLAAPCRA